MKFFVKIHKLNPGGDQRAKDKNNSKNANDYIERDGMFTI